MIASVGVHKCLLFFRQSIAVFSPLLPQSIVIYVLYTLAVLGTLSKNIRLTILAALAVGYYQNE